MLIFQVTVIRSCRNQSHDQLRSTEINKAVQVHYINTSSAGMCILSVDRLISSAYSKENGPRENGSNGILNRVQRQKKVKFSRTINYSKG